MLRAKVALKGAFPKIGEWQARVLCRRRGAHQGWGRWEVNTARTALARHSQASTLAHAPAPASCSSPSCCCPPSTTPSPLHAGLRTLEWGTWQGKQNNKALWRLGTGLLQ